MVVDLDLVHGLAWQAISKLANPSIWDEVPGDGPEKARKMEKAAAYCRRVGRGDVASSLHRLAASLAAHCPYARC